MPLDKVMDSQLYPTPVPGRQDMEARHGGPTENRWERDQKGRFDFTPPREPGPIPDCCGLCKFFIVDRPGYGRCRKTPPTRETLTWTFYGLLPTSNYRRVPADLEACGEFKRVPRASDADATYQVEDRTVSR